MIYIRYLTKQNRAILDIIECADDHMTAEEIYRRVRKVMPHISVGTVYRNLNALSDEGSIRRISLPCGPDRYDKNVMPHGHLVCEMCGSVSDLFVEQVQSIIKETLGTERFSYELNVSALCDRCRQLATHDAERVLL